MGWGWLREIAEVVAPVMKYDLVHKVDARIANETADLLQKTPIGEKDPILAKQAADTVDYGETPQQIANQAQVAGTIATVVYTAGALGTETAGAGGGLTAPSGFAGTSPGLTAPAGFAGTSPGLVAGGSSLLSTELAAGLAASSLTAAEIAQGLGGSTALATAGEVSGAATLAENIANSAIVKEAANTVAGGLVDNWAGGTPNFYSDTVGNPFIPFEEIPAEKMPVENWLIIGVGVFLTISIAVALGKAK